MIQVTPEQKMEFLTIWKKAMRSTPAALRENNDSGDTGTKNGSNQSLSIYR